ncbi:hypothetical protein COT70_01220 [candidate division WWE3 bacterium CG09_land_8_20_14_0_10_47_33]|uniref:Transposase IS200-like domain-containing protein n=1 Tax=candidate division WWE3 bacterium CG_4_9_14_0_2_um_filter_48_10 TaxID=1975078 RepID=A0A2M8EHY8_UNCKA|nr:MAG: hypothetical protein COT70_01220 [candidate division WWE3 bacterium CG09_land_8_20_14_0_10_47_33]PIZ40574.1 MAG: hypothetical protein COY35_02005 [candidate division WWE3 bacterium CG_4_10_14_0_2_um_filter_47_8]PJC21946.1 MAG: hypothetical protein CO059_02945 [candidate division WWE3 bacterium CG_4_9_14_0_2_um_filter_48_10]PJE52321.1 MAG: hypothetical protein COV28_00280 [candidate division WWE3 bacterium CG10_big_fil_rev_8_21_14_0_10_48_23]
MGEVGGSNPPRSTTPYTLDRTLTRLNPVIILFPEVPAKNIVKTYIADCYYHAYNRGVDKRIIFLDDQDYRVFLHLLKIYLSPKSKENPPLTRLNLVRPRPVQSVSGEVQLIAYCLMPNHFHLLLKQKSKVGMTKLMRKISTTYAMYFNNRYKRVGTLFQGIYKAALIDSEHYLLHLSRYIHLNPSELTRNILVNYPYSSYPYYLDQKNAKWIDPTPILSYFRSEKKNLLKPVNSYRDFVEAYQEDSSEILGPLILE